MGPEGLLRCVIGDLQLVIRQIVDLRQLMPDQHILLYDIYDVNIGTKSHDVTRRNAIYIMVYDRRTQMNIVYHLVADCRNDFLAMLWHARWPVSTSDPWPVCNSYAKSRE
jgi:hypothetical protein